MAEAVSAATTAALGKALDLAKDLGILQKVKAKLIGDPNTAAQHLTGALLEVHRTLGALRDTLLEVSYLGAPGQDIVDVRRALDRIESGRLYEEVIRAKGSCGKIGNIYDRHLGAWFKALLYEQEQEEVRALFDHLRNSDGGAIDAMEQFLQDARPLAAEIRLLFEANRKAEAKQQVRKFVATLRPVIEELGATMVFMFDLEAEFIKRHGLT